MSLPEIFRTQRLILRPPVPADADDIFRVYAQDREITRFLSWEAQTDLRNVRIGTQQRIARHHAEQEFSWCITMVDTGALMGMLTIQPAGFFRECGFVLGRPFWNQGFMTEALCNVASWAMTHPEPLRFWACCDVQHHASARVLEKSGFVRNNVLRSWVVHPAQGSEPRDCYYYVLPRRSEEVRDAVAAKAIRHIKTERPTTSKQPFT